MRAPAPRATRKSARFDPSAMRILKNHAIFASARNATRKCAAAAVAKGAKDALACFAILALQTTVSSAECAKKSIAQTSVYKAPRSVTCVRRKFVMIAAAGTRRFNAVVVRNKFARNAARSPVAACTEAVNANSVMIVRILG